MFVNELHQGGIRALINYDGTIFDSMSLPEGVELQEVVDRILFKYGDTPLFTPEPAVMKYYIKQWSKRHLNQWTKFKAAIDFKYDPLYNYDRTETHSETIKHNGTDNLTLGSSIENTISADNAATYQPDNKSQNSGTDSREIDSTDTIERSIRAFGNIGVTTSQQMLRSEIDLIPELDLIEFIVNDFRSEFCLDIYY